MTGTFDGYVYIMRFVFTLVYVCVDVKLLISISYSFRKSLFWQKMLKSLSLVL
jgi:hypothetical protein